MLKIAASSGECRLKCVRSPAGSAGTGIDLTQRARHPAVDNAVTALKVLTTASAVLLDCALSIGVEHGTALAATVVSPPSEKRGIRFEA